MMLFEATFEESMFLIMVSSKPTSADSSVSFWVVDVMSGNNTLLREYH